MTLLLISARPQLFSKGDDRRLFGTHWRKLDLLAPSRLDRRSPLLLSTETFRLLCFTPLEKRSEHPCEFGRPF